MRLRFRLQNVQVQPAGAGQPGDVEAGNPQPGHDATYETVPVALMIITRITTANGDQSGTWSTSETAMTAAGFTNENYDPLPRLVGRASTGWPRTSPAGTIRQFAYLLDGDGGNQHDLD